MRIASGNQCSAASSKPSRFTCCRSVWIPVEQTSVKRRRYLWRFVQTFRLMVECQPAGVLQKSQCVFGISSVRQQRLPMLDFLDPRLRSMLLRPRCAGSANSVELLDVLVVQPVTVIVRSGNELSQWNAAVLCQGKVLEKSDLFRRSFLGECGLITGH